MRYLAILVFFITIEASALTNKIVAVVNDYPITQYDYQNRKKMFKHLNKIDQLDKEEKVMFDKMVLNGLIDESLINQVAEKYQISISDDEVTEAIKAIEKENKKKSGDFLAELRSNNVDIQTVRNHIKNELIKNKLVSEVLMRSVVISQSEIDNAVISSDSKDLVVSLKIISAENSQSNYKKMISLQDKKLDCEKVEKQNFNFANISTLDTTFSKLSKEVKTIVMGLSTSEHSNVIKIGDKLYIYLVCQKEVKNLTLEENDYISRVLGTKKLGIKIQKFLNQLRRKAYIKVMQN